MNVPLSTRYRLHWKDRSVVNLWPHDVPAVLWAPGIVVLLAVGSHLALASFGVPKHSSDWAAALLVGVLLPVGTVVLARPEAPRLARLVLAVLAAGAAVAFVAMTLSIEMYAVAALHLALVATLTRRRRRVGDVVIAYPLVAASWATSAGLIYWRGFGELVLAAPYNLAAFVAVLVTTVLVLHCEAPPWRLGPWDLAGAVVLTLVAFRSAALQFDPASLHHWGPIVGPAAMVRDGGWLLWDVPAQYGTGLTLTLAVLPTADAWQSLYVLHGALIVVGGLAVYGLVRAATVGPAGVILALVATVASITLMGSPADLRGPQWLPNVGLTRFGWPIVLMGIVGWQLVARPRIWVALVLGHLVWLIGTVWSVENALYCAAAWLPASAILGWSGGPRLRALALAGPLLLLAVTVLSVTSYYLVNLGHAPDWWAYVEYTMAFSLGLVDSEASRRITALVDEYTVNPLGAVWVAAIVAAGTAVVASHVLSMRRSPRALAAAASAYGAHAGVLTYYLARPAAINFDCLAPVILAALALTMRAARSSELPDRAFRHLAIVFTPVVAVIILAVIGNGSMLLNALTPWGPLYEPNIASRLPPLDDELARLLRENGADPERIILLGRDVVPVPELRPWLPIAPAVLIPPLADDRRSVYLSRWISRRRMGGWIVRRDGAELLGAEYEWLASALRPSHTLTRQVLGDGWELIRFEPRAAV